MIIGEEKQQVCNDCNRISCGKCDWVASDEEVIKILNQELTCCPLCGWRPEL